MRSERKILQHAFTQRVFPRFAIIEKIRWWKEAGHCLHAAGNLLSGVRGLGISGVSRHALHQRQMSAGRSTGDANAIGVNLIIRGMSPNEADDAVHVRQDFRNGILGLAAVDHGKDGITPLEKLRRKCG